MVMFEDYPAAHTWVALPWMVLLLIVSKAFYNKFFTGLSNIPGPALASWTDLWRFRLVHG